MSFGEYADLDHYMSNWKTMDQAMSVLFRPVKNSYKDKYTIEDYDTDKLDYMGSMKLDAVFGALFFLENLNKELSKHILHYSAKLAKSLPKAQRSHLLKRMDSGHPFTLLQEETF